MSLADFVAEAVQDLFQPTLRRVEHSVIVKRPATAKVLHRHDDAEPGGLEHLHRSLRGPRMEVIIERIRPENDGWFIGIVARCVYGTNP